MKKKSKDSQELTQTNYPELPQKPSEKENPTDFVDFGTIELPTNTNPPDFEHTSSQVASSKLDEESLILQASSSSQIKSVESTKVNKDSDFELQTLQKKPKAVELSERLDEDSESRSDIIAPVEVSLNEDSKFHEDLERHLASTSKEQDHNDEISQFKSLEEMDLSVDQTQKVAAFSDDTIPPVEGGYSQPATSSMSLGQGLAQSENLRVAQQRIRDLEKENDRLRSENEELASAAETFRNKADKLEQRTLTAEGRFEDLSDSVDSEKKVLLHSIAERESEVFQLKQKLEDLELRLQTGVKKIRVRERELENRLELVKLEGKALLSSKDEMILGLKRQIDHLSLELESARNKVQESNKGIQQKQEIVRKTVKTLRLALSLLETEDPRGSQKLKKVD